MRTKLLQLSKQANKCFWWNRSFLDDCNIHLIVSTYTRESRIKKIQNILTDQSGFCMWCEGEALYGCNTKEKDGDYYLLASIWVGTCSHYTKTLST